MAVNNVLLKLGKVLLVAAFLYLGIVVGPFVKNVYDGWQEGPIITEGDHGQILRESGTAVVLFSTSTCPYCQRTRELLSIEQISFKDYVLDESDEGRGLYESLGEAGVPVLIVGSKRVVGFREDAIREILSELKKESVLQ